MKSIMGSKLKRAIALLLVVNMVLALAVGTDVYYDGDDRAFAAESSVMGTNNFVAPGATLTAGETYSFGGYDWVAAEVQNGYTVLQSCGVTSGPWPGYVMGGTITNAAGETLSLGNANIFCNSNINGYDISGYDAKTQNLYNAIKETEYTSAAYGKGLFLVSKDQISFPISSSPYGMGLLTAANNFVEKVAVTGSVDTSNVGSVYSVTSYYNGSVQSVAANNSQSFVIAPAFNLDTSKVILGADGKTIEIYKAPTVITATKSAEPIEEGKITDLNGIINGVTYADGHTAGKSASYKISASEGTINGTTWTSSSVGTVDKNVEFTITETESGRNLSTKETVTVTPTTAKSTELTKAREFPAIQDGETINLSEYIASVKTTDSADNSDGEFTLSEIYRNEKGLSGASVTSSHGDEGDSFAEKDGSLYFTPGEVTKPTDINITVNLGTVGSVDYSGQPQTFTITVNPKTTDWTDRNDKQLWHEYKDEATNIVWKFKYNDTGDIQYLYTESDISGIVKDNVLVVPSSINGVKVVGIGGGWSSTSGDTGEEIKNSTKETIPFIPTGKDKEGQQNTWTSIYIPASVTTINDCAFLDNDTSAEIVIPKTVKEIGVRAFQRSGIKKVTFNADSTTVTENKLKLCDESFKDIETLTDVVFRGSIVLSKRVFCNDTKVTRIDIPSGIQFAESDNNFSFQGTAGLETIKIDTAAVPSNLFTGNKNLKKVIFGENVTDVAADWSGTARSVNVTEGETIADRTTCVLNENTKFTFTDTASPFGYGDGTNTLTVKGKKPSEEFNMDGSSESTQNGYWAKFGYFGTVGNSLSGEYKTYAQNTAGNITFNISKEYSQDEDLNSATKQTGIEAYYNGTILTGKDLDKDKMNVYEMFDTTQKDSYPTDEFFVFSEKDADKILCKQFSSTPDGENSVASSEDDVLEYFKNNDGVTAGEEEGTINVRVIVLKRTDDGKILLRSNETDENVVDRYEAKVTIPVKQYTAEDDFFENYGSYEAVMEEIDELNVQLEKAEKDAETDKAKVAELNEKLASLVENYEKLLNSTTGSDGSAVGKDDYTYSITDENGNTTDHVIVNGTEYEYDKNSGQTVTADGTDVTVFKATDNEGNEFYFYVDDKGVHVVEVTTDESGAITGIGSDKIATTDADTILALQRKLAKEISDLKDRCTKLTAAMDDFGETLKDWIGGYDAEAFKNLTDDQKIEKINAAIESLQAAYTDYKERYETLNGQYDTLKNAADNLTTANADITAAKDALEQYLSNKESAEALNILNQAYAKMNSSYTALNDSYNSLNAAYEAIKTPAEPVKEAYEAITAAKKKLDSAYTSLTDAKEKLDSGAASDEIYTDLNAAQGDLTDASGKLQTASEELSKKIGSLQSTVGDYQTALKNIRSALGLVETDSADIADILDALEGSYNTLADEITDLCSKLKALGIDITLPDNATEADKLDAIYNAVAALKEKYDSLKDDYNTVLRKIYGETDENVDLSDKDVDDILTQVGALQGDTAAIEDQIKDAIGESGENKDLTELLNEVKKMSEDLSAQNDILKQIRETLGVTDNASILQKIIALQTENADLKKQIAAGSTGTTDTAGYTKGYNEGYAAAVKALGNTSTATTTLTTQITSLTAENKDLTTENSTLKTGINDLYDGVLEKGTVSNGKTLYGAGKDTSSYTAKLDKVETYYGDAIDQAKSLEKENATLSSKNSSLSSKNSSLNKKYKSATAKNKSLSKKVDTLNSTISKQNSTISSLKNKSNSTTYKPATTTTGTTTAGTTTKKTTEKPATIKVQSNSSSKDTSKEEEDEKKVAETEEPETTEMTQSTEASATLEDLPDTNSTYQSNNNQQEATEAPEETEETEEKGSSPLPLILFGIVLVAIIGGIVFIFIIKPRLGSGDDNDDDDDDDDETV